MKTKIPIWMFAVALLCFAFAVTKYKMSNNHVPLLTPEQKRISQAFTDDYAHKYMAITNNGSKRMSFPEDQVPAEAREIAQQYHTIVYPAIKNVSQNARVGSSAYQ